jgi:hypothetical protein
MRILFGLLLLLLSLVADDNPCQKKLLESTLLYPKYAVAITSNKGLYHTKKWYKNKNVIKRDPFLGLHLVRNSRGSNFIKLIPNSPKKLYVVNHKSKRPGYVKSAQVGLSKLATFSQTTPSNSVIMGDCCTMLGFGAGKKGYIEYPYIKHFIKHGARYSDIGIRLKKWIKKPIVASVDPFVYNPFQVGDEIVKVNNRVVKTSAIVMQKILFSPIGKKMTIHVKRGKSIKKFSVKTFKRRGGGYISDTFLESLGANFRWNGVVSYIVKGGKLDEKGVHVGDKLIAVNGYKVNNVTEIRQLVAKPSLLDRNKFHFLFQRGKFQYFVNFPRKSHTPFDRGNIFTPIKY